MAFTVFSRAENYQNFSSFGGCWVSTKGSAWKKKKESTWSKPGSWKTTESHQTDLHPVTCVSWNDAQAFIRWLSHKEGMNYGLPTEAEWEYAGRASTSTPFAFGRCLSTDQGNYGGIGPLFADCRDVYRINRKKSIRVASLAPNPWGLFDMHGNVSEWCQNWYDGYPSRPVTDPKGPSSGTDRVMRGGHWSANAQKMPLCRAWQISTGQRFGRACVSARDETLRNHHESTAHLSSTQPTNS